MDGHLDPLDGGVLVQDRLGDGAGEPLDQPEAGLGDDPASGLGQPVVVEGVLELVGGGRPLDLPTNL